MRGGEAHAEAQVLGVAETAARYPIEDTADNLTGFERCRDLASRHYAHWCAGLDHAMSERVERSRGLGDAAAGTAAGASCCTLGQMAMRQIRSTSRAEERIPMMTTGISWHRSPAACSGEDLSAAS